MSRSRHHRAPALCALALASICFSSCATTHLLHWSRDEPSLYTQHNDERFRGFLKPGGTVLAAPAAVAWDLVTLPFQWGFGVHPFGDRMVPAAVAQE